MPGVANLVELLPALIRLCPELVTGTVTRGKIIALFNVEPDTDADLQRKLSPKSKAKQRPKFNDAVRVLKVADAIKCTESKFNDTSLLAQFLLTACREVFTQETGVTAAQKLTDQMAECFRDKSLKQTTPRKTKRSTNIGRPARGHGH